MNNNYSVETFHKNWWLIAIRGVLAVLFGILVIASPYIVMFSLITFFAFFAILSGFFIITLAMLGVTESRWIRLLEGLIFIASGIVVFLNPVTIVGGVMIFIAAWAILSGILQILGAIRLRRIITNEWFMIFNGAISIIFGIILAGNLIQGAGVMLIVFGVFAILSGLFSIILAFKIKTFKLNN
ncbi:MAG: DUF308 domain-containing protein [Ignavibacteria bacterium]|nr:DUF308 domain-containing protein [Ignavibacteria bacterium]